MSDVVVEMRRMILDDHFQANVRFVVDFIEPINDVIRFVDVDSSCLKYMSALIPCVRGSKQS